MLPWANGERAASVLLLIGDGVHVEVARHVGLDRERLAAGVAHVCLAVERVVDPPRAACSVTTSTKVCG